MKMIAKTLFGLENVLEKELSQLGASSVKVLNRAVSFEGELEMLYRANYCCRTALSILVPVQSFYIRNAKDIYHRALKIKWDNHIGIDQTFSIVPVVHSKLFNHSGYPALVLKDAIADYFNHKYNRRPSVDTARPDILVNLHIRENEVNISLDSSGVPLYKRGYRISQSIAPLNEVLAAGIVKMSGWDPSRPLMDPMCGTATIPIEAAMIALNIPPGKFRSSFGFMKWSDYDEELFLGIRDQANAKVVERDFSITCSDISTEAVSSATMNLASAGFSNHINLYTRDFFRSGSGNDGYTIITNPPYGERIKEDDINRFYSDIGERLKHGYNSSQAWIITSNLSALKHVGLKPSEKHTLYNGALECRLVRYDMYQGSIKQKREPRATI